MHATIVCFLVFSRLPAVFLLSPVYFSSVCFCSSALPVRSHLIPGLISLTCHPLVHQQQPSLIVPVRLQSGIVLTCPFWVSSMTLSVSFLGSWGVFFAAILAFFSCVFLDLNNLFSSPSFGFFLHKPRHSNWKSRIRNGTKNKISIGLRLVL